MEPIQVNQNECKSFTECNKENAPQTPKRQLKRKYSEPSNQTENQKKIKHEPVTIINHLKIDHKLLVNNFKF